MKQQSEHISTESRNPFPVDPPEPWPQPGDPPPMH